MRDRNGVPGAAALFNGLGGDKQQFVTVQAPFPNVDREFTIAVWLKPTIIDNDWHRYFVPATHDLEKKRAPF